MLKLRIDTHYRLLQVIGLTALFGCATSTTKAGYLEAYSGNTRASIINVGQLATEFAVLDQFNGNSSPGDVFGTGLPNFDNLAVGLNGSTMIDTSARYLYLYQEVISPTSPDAFVDEVFGDSTQRFLHVTSFAAWNAVLSDDNGPVTTANDFGTDGVAYAPSASANLGVTDPSVASTTQVLNQVFLSSTPTELESSFYIPPGYTSQLYGFTTNTPPTLLAQVEQPNFAAGTIPVPVPEPSSALLACLACLGTLCAGRRFTH